MRFSAHADNRKAAATCTVALLCMSAAGLAGAQSSTRITPLPAPPATTSGSRPDYTDPSLLLRPDQNMFGQEDLSTRVIRLNARRDELKKRMAQNAARLLQLTTELRSDLQNREPTEADGKRLDEIARLAHAVRDGMRQ